MNKNLDPGRISLHPPLDDLQWPHLARNAEEPV